MSEFVAWYLLVGFMLHFVTSEVFKIDRNPEGWRWELAACMLWPVVIIVAVVRAISGRFVGV